jgi:hypothetical protein
MRLTAIQSRVTLRNIFARGGYGIQHELHISRGGRVTLTRPVRTVHGLLAKLIPRQRGEYKMNKAYLMSLTGLAALALSSTTSWAQCTNSNLNGTYAFTVHGQSITVAADGSSFTSTGLIDGVGQITFDGNGNLTQHDFIVKNSAFVPGGGPDEDGFHNGETGTYTVNDDCTGNAVITLSPGNTRSLELVLADNGRTAHAIVSSSTVNGAPAMLQVYSDFQKLQGR